MERCVGFAPCWVESPSGHPLAPLVLGQCGREYEQGSVNMSVHELAAQGKEVAGKEARG